ncbi:MAG: phosphoglucosamine mutase [Planctomycetaceae bacterium]|nr:phosphoglucosamine mutase [Planctomycetaceae bacterium]
MPSLVPCGGPDAVGLGVPILTGGIHPSSGGRKPSHDAAGSLLDRHGDDFAGGWNPRTDPDRDVLRDALRGGVEPVEGRGSVDRPPGERGYDVPEQGLHEVEVDEQVLLVQTGTAERHGDPPVMAVELLADATDGHRMGRRESVRYFKFEHVSSIGQWPFHPIERMRTNVRNPPSPIAGVTVSDAPLMLSISGARGIVGATMTPEIVARYAGAFGSLLRETTGSREPRLVVGHDGRRSGSCLASAAAAGLAGVGCEVTLLGVSTTPTVGVMIGELGCDGGINVTASHNPIEWNGIKCLDSDGLAPPGPVASEIIARFEGSRLDRMAGADCGSIRHRDDASRIHVEKVLAIVDVELVRSKRFRVVLDSVAASGGPAGRMLLEALGCDLVHLHGRPTGIFPHTPEPTEANLTELAKTVAEDGTAAVGFAQDPDADRLAIVDGNGRYIGEERTLVLATLRTMQRHGGGPVAANLSTSRMIDDVCAGFPGGRVVRTAVGEANVVQGIREHQGRIGGEGNGGVIVPEVCFIRDSLSAMALVLELLAEDGRGLAAIVDAMPGYAMIKRKWDLSSVGGKSAVPRILEKVAGHWSEGRVDDADGVRVDVGDAWVHVRPSNTEPIIRLIAEAPTEAAAAAIADEAATVAGIS